MIELPTIPRGCSLAVGSSGGQNRSVRAQTLHSWDLSPREAAALQERLRERVREEALPWEKLRRVAGCDVACDGETLIAAVVVLDLESMRIVETADARCPARFPYVPGLLSFREIPALLEAFAGIRRRPDALLCDGQGRAHPRRFGLACHLGVALDLPSVGVAKSRLIGEARMPARRRGSSTPILHNGELVGRLLRSRDGVRPLYVSVGHRITLEDAVRLVLAMGGGFRLPEPTRLADQRVRLLKRQDRA
jgi:deoxyribonuclease V